MLYKFLVVLTLVICACPGTSDAAPKVLIDFDLSLAGYRLGMSYDDVAQVGPFHYKQSALMSPENTPIFYALVDSVYVEGVPMEMQLSFKNDKVHKIVARVLPDSFEDVLLIFQQAVGRGTDRSKTFLNYDNKEIRQTVYMWDFPNAEMFLVGVSTNTASATIGLIEK